MLHYVLHGVIRPSPGPIKNIIDRVWVWVWVCGVLCALCPVLCWLMMWMQVTCAAPQHWCCLHFRSSPLAAETYPQVLLGACLLVVAWLCTRGAQLMDVVSKRTLKGVRKESVKNFAHGVHVVLGCVCAACSLFLLHQCAQSILYWYCVHRFHFGCEGSGGLHLQVLWRGVVWPLILRTLQHACVLLCRAWTLATRPAIPGVSWCGRLVCRKVFPLCALPPCNNVTVGQALLWRKLDVDACGCTHR